MKKKIAFLSVLIALTLLLTGCPNAKAKVTYVSAFGNVPSQPFEFEPGTAITPYDIPHLDFYTDEIGNTYTFVGWYIGEEEFDVGYTVTKDVTVTAKWDTIKITFTSEETNASEVRELPRVRLVYLPNNVLSREGFVIASYSKEDGSKSYYPYDSSKKDLYLFGEDTTLKINWAAKITIALCDTDGVLEIGRVETYSGAEVAIPFKDSYFKDEYKNAGATDYYFEDTKTGKKYNKNAKGTFTEDTKLKMVLVYKKNDQMIKINGSTVPADVAFYNRPVRNQEFTVNSFKISSTELSYNLWYEVYQWAIQNGYKFANKGMEGGFTKKYTTVGEYNKGAPKFTGTVKYPATHMTWRDAVVWCNAYSEKEGLTPVYKYNGEVLREAERDGEDYKLYSDTADEAYCSGLAVCGKGKAENATVDTSANGFRLPTKVEWEFAFRGGDYNSDWWTKDWLDSNIQAQYAVVGLNSLKEDAHELNSLAEYPNGLYDMLGNVEEFVYYIDDAKEWTGMMGGCYYSTYYKNKPYMTSAAYFSKLNMTTRGFRVAQNAD